MKSYADLLQENNDLKRQIKKMQYENLKNSIEFERLKKLADDAVGQVDRVMKVVSN